MFNPDKFARKGEGRAGLQNNDAKISIVNFEWGVKAARNSLPE